MYSQFNICEMPRKNHKIVVTYHYIAQSMLYYMEFKQHFKHKVCYSKDYLVVEKKIKELKQKKQNTPFSSPTPTHKYSHTLTPTSSNTPRMQDSPTCLTKSEPNILNIYAYTKCQHLMPSLVIIPILHKDSNTMYDIQCHHF